MLRLSTPDISVFQMAGNSIGSASALKVRSNGSTIRRRDMPCDTSASDAVLLHKNRHRTDDELKRRAIFPLSRNGLGFADLLQLAIRQTDACANIIIDQSAVSRAG